jgi:hypothetical protein
MQMGAIPAVAGDEAVMKEYDAAMQKMVDAIGLKGIDAVFALTATGPAKGIEAVAIYSLEDPAKYRQATIESMKVIKPLLDKMPNPMFTMSLDYKQGADKIGKYEVDQVTVKFQMGAEAGQDQAGQMMNMVMMGLFGGNEFTQSVVYTDKYVFMASGSGAKKTLEDTINAVDQKKVLLGTTPLAAAAAKAVPAKSVMMGYLSPMGLVKWIGGLGVIPNMGVNVAEILDKLPPGKGAFSVALVTVENGAEFQLDVPAAATKDVMDIIMEVQKTIQQMAPPGGNAPPPGI